MALEREEWTETELAAEKCFTDGREIDLRDSGSIRASVLEEVCTAAWREGRHSNLRIRGGTITEDFELNDIRTEAAVHLSGVRLGALGLRRSTLNVLILTDCDVQRIEAAGLETKRGVDLNGEFRSHGRVRLVGAVIGGDLNCDGATFGRSDDDLKKGRSALNFDSARIQGNVRLKNSKADGLVTAELARVGGAFICPGATFANNQGGSLTLRHATAGDYGDFSGCKATGAVTMSATRFGGGASFKGATIAGDLLLKNLAAEGRLNLNGISVRPWQPDPTDKYHRDASTYAGAVQLEGAQLGSLSMKEAATVAGDLDVHHVSVDRDMTLEDVSVGGQKADLRNTTVGGVLTAQRVRATGEACVARLQGLSVGELNDSPESWPARPAECCEQRRPDRHFIDGVTIGALRRPHIKWRIQWLKSNGAWTPQPWQQMGAALRDRGHDAEARRLAVARENARTRSLGWWRKPGRWLLYVTIGYGYRPILALVWAAAIVGGCALLFKNAQFEHAANAPERARLLYSIDAFVPVDLGYFSKWSPTEAGWSAVAVGEAALGWLLAALLLGALTGLLKKD